MKQMDEGGRGSTRKKERECVNKQNINKYVKVILVLFIYIYIYI